MKKIGNVSPYLFENALIIALSTDWISQFNQVPDFDVIINNKGRLQLVSKESINGEKND